MAGKSSIVRHRPTLFMRRNENVPSDEYQSFNAMRISKVDPLSYKHVHIYLGVVIAPLSSGNHCVTVPSDILNLGNSLKQ